MNFVAAGAAAASFTTFIPPGTEASGFVITLCRVEGAFGSEKSWVMPQARRPASRSRTNSPTRPPPGGAAGSRPSTAATAGGAW